jgi:nucleotide-binding universal stress UspA family protein
LLSLASCTRRTLAAAAAQGGLFASGDKMTGNTEHAAGRIVVGVDGTAASLAAVRWAVQEAVLRQASVHLVAACDGHRRASYAGSQASHPDGDDADGRALLAAELEAGRVLPPGRWSSERADGSPAKVLIDRSAGAELLILGRAYLAGQPAGQLPPAMGSVARACLHGVACPVVVMAACEGVAHPRDGALPMLGQAIR